jgi:peptidoglycan/LPS O-acetylase OafA/YrhL
MDNYPKIYFKNLDGLRMIAATLVILTHCNAVFNEAGKRNPYSFIFSNGGKFGVDLFFTLSGFLISFLLMKEINEKGGIHTRLFLIRRILRTWPLYFATGLAGIFLGPFLLNYLNPEYGKLSFSQYWQNFIHLITFTVNFQVQYGEKNFGIVSTLWSICIEEQFYFVWPFLISFFRRNLLALFILTTLIGIIYYGFIPQKAHYSTIVRFYHFGIGALGAYLYLYRCSVPALQKIASFFLNKYLQVIVLALITAVIVKVIDVPNLNTFYYGLFSLYIILVSVSSSSVINLEWRLIRYLGKISYGLYMFHLFVIQVCFYFLVRMFHSLDGWFYPVFMLVSYFLTVLLSSLSYELFEKYFLKIKAGLGGKIYGVRS